MRATRFRLATALVFLLGCSSRRGPVPILAWHAIAETRGSWDVAPDLLAAQLDAIVAAGYRSVSLHQAIAHEDFAAPLPERPIVLTFDDGTEDQLTRTLPLLQARRLRASFFLVASWVGEDEAHRRVAREDGVERRYLIAPEVRLLLAAGMEIGSHGFTHARLPLLSRSSAAEEMVRSRERLSYLVGAPVDLFAYPYNALRRPHREMARSAGYAAAVAGVVHGSGDRFSLYRAPITGSTTPQALLAMLSRWR